LLFCQQPLSPFLISFVGLAGWHGGAETERRSGR
jgi:hypothetical protein